MPYIPRVYFSEFRECVENRFNEDFEEFAYREAVYHAVNINVWDHFFKADHSTKSDEIWADWIDGAKDGFDVGWGEVCGLSKSRLKDMGRRKGAVVHALAAHYRTHMYHTAEDLEIAHKLDQKLLSLGEDRLFNNPVFIHDPDIFREVPDPSAPMIYPPYHLSKEVERTLAENKDHSIWLDPHNHTTIPLEGRQAEMDRLNAFMRAPGNFRIMPVIGPSGAGKTRLISEWMKPYVATLFETKWEAGIVVSGKRMENARDPVPWQRWDIENDTLIAIDYTYAFDEVVKTIAHKARNQAASRTGVAAPGHKVRLIVVDHVMPDILQNDFFWRELASGHASVAESFKAQYIEKPILLEGQDDTSKLLKHVVAAAASVGQQQVLSIEDTEVEKAYLHLERMGQEQLESQGGRDVVRHPLFAALLGQVIRNASGSPDFSKWSRRDLISYYFKNPDRLPWAGHAPGSNREKKGLFAGALVSAATLRRGLHLAQVRDYHPSQHEDVRQIACRVVSSDDNYLIPEFLPDILGETFLLKYLSEIFDKQPSMELLNSLLFENSDSYARISSYQFTSVLRRLLHNLSADDATQEEVAELWTALFTLIKVIKISPDVSIRLLMNQAITDVTRALLKAARHAGSTISGTNAANHFQMLIDCVGAEYDLSALFCLDPELGVAKEIESAIEFVGMFPNLCSETELKSLAHLIEAHVRDGMFRPLARVLIFQGGGLRSLRTLHPYLREKINARDRNGRTCALIACEDGNLGVLKFLLEQGASLRRHSKHNSTAAMLASSNGHLEVLRFLQSNGENLRKKNKHGWSAAVAAISGGHGEVLQFLFDNGIKPKDVRYSAESVAHFACQNGHPNILAVLIDAGVKFDERDKHGWDLAILASCWGSHKLLPILAQQGVDLAAVAKDGRTAAIVAISHGHVDVLRVLKDHGINILETTNDGWSPVMEACQWDKLEILEFLHENGACLTSKRKDGLTAAAIAIERGHVQITEYLSEHDALFDKNMVAGLSEAKLANLAEQDSVLRFLADQGDLEAIALIRRPALYRFAIGKFHFVCFFFRLKAVWLRLFVADRLARLVRFLRLKK